MSQARSGPLAASDFFAQQEAARKRTGRLIILFLLAVVAIIAAVYLVVAFAFLMLGGQRQALTGAAGLERLWDWRLFSGVALGTSALVGGGSAYRIVSLAGGGAKVAQLLGGRLIDTHTRDLDERRVLNVVEEMALASGCPVPPVYLLENERGINAFAAGDDPNNAVIGVTRGTVELLSRDELQGVIAHEFSHILNGDMRLNLRLMGVLFGILLISMTGWTILRSTRFSSVRSNGGRRDGVNPLPFIGLGLWILGYIGVFFGRLIKAGVSRQREYLADASAVQFTRNPQGLAGALKKIGAFQEGSRLETPEAEEASHMFFGEGLGLSGWNPLSTHPPLTERIRRIDPSFDGDYSRVSLEPPPVRAVDVELRRRMSEARIGAGQSPLQERAERRIPFNPAQAVQRVGTLGPGSIAYAASMIEGMADPVTEAVRDPLGACAVIYALLLDPRDTDVREAQWARVVGSSTPPIREFFERVAPLVERTPPEQRFPLVELCMPAMQRLNPVRFREFVDNLRHLMEIDRRITLFEYALRRMLLRNLGPRFGWGERPEETIDRIEPLIEPVGMVLSALAHVGHGSEHDSRAAYTRAEAELGWPIALPGLRSAEDANLKNLDAALNQLAYATPRLKKPFLQACAACISHDGRLTIEEGEMLRAISEALDCPMPPLVPLSAE